MWSKPLLCRFRQPGEIQQTQVSQGFAAFRLTLSRIHPRHSQIKRDTNFATPGYSLSCHDTTASGKNKDYSVCGHLCGQSCFCAAFCNRGKSRKCRRRKALRRFTLPRPGYRHGTPKAGALPAALHPDMYFSARQHAFAHILKGNGAFCRTHFPRSRSAAACAFRLHRRQACTFCNLRKIKFNTFFRNSQRFSALQFRVGCGMLYK